MSSSPNNAEILAEVLTQDILPKASSPILWIFVFVAVSISILLRALLFPCVTLSSLRRTVDAVDELLKGHEAGIHTMHTSIVSDGCVDCTDSLRQCINYKQSWLRIYERDRNSSWTMCFSLTRHSITLSTKQHNDRKLDSNATQLRRRNTSNPQSFAAGGATKKESTIRDSDGHPSARTAKVTCPGSDTETIVDCSRKVYRDTCEIPDGVGLCATRREKRTLLDDIERCGTSACEVLDNGNPATKTKTD
ncbi:hypothetical protein BDP27DRAFT_1359048 [Rhodocollybia butyracea]|uniref:Transmembrane protein n=1 Tax=Rhodocollybia butyracea TaxID=206335 RepID=A0A9P5UD40_9AGAR|nr:hypothetical protein BDP27DRAFT_1359048 [Rhodocollybia butyracea]